ncbi:MAG: hypothetical protein QOJ35_560 [Solirubrobacteraceae bacterium]|nr:hypothetical protein [Solirubrobacteraceae bacterium]
MRTTITTAAGLAAAITACAAGALVGGGALAAAAASKTPPPGGTSFVAATPDGGVQLVLSRDRHQVRHALFAYRQACSDGDVTYDYDSYVAIPIGANRKFSYRYESAPRPSTTTPGATVSYTESINGTLSKSGTRIVGTARSTFALANPAGASYSCDTGTVTFKAAD